MIAGWIDVHGVPALVAVESLARPCRVDVLMHVRQAWRAVFVGEWDPFRRAVEPTHYDAAFDGAALMRVVLEALEEWTADGGTGLARYAPGSVPTMTATAPRRVRAGLLARARRWLAAR